jgi:hypothetical protein
MGRFSLEGQIGYVPPPSQAEFHNYQAGNASVGDLKQSAASKQRDFSITQKVLGASGDTLQDTMKQVLVPSPARGRMFVSIDVTRLDEFDIGDFFNELDGKKLLDLGIGSLDVEKAAVQETGVQIPLRCAPGSQEQGGRGNRCRLASQGDLMEELDVQVLIRNAIQE